jgi:phospholipid/cholesterol/gamma-HCH transport system substrate-binding protein
MNERSMQVWVGLMMLATLIALCILAITFGTLPKWIGGEYTLYITFSQAPGVSAGTPVRKSGILIGRVTDVGFAKDGSSIVVAVEIQEKYKIYRNEDCRVQTNLLGDAVLEFFRSPEGGPPGARVPADSHLAGVFLPSPNDLVSNLQTDFKSTITSVNRTSRKLYDASESLADILKANSQGIKDTINNTNQLVVETRAIVGDDKTRERLRKAIDDLPRMLDDTTETIDAIKTTMKSVQDNMKNLNRFTESLGNNGPTLISNLNQSTSRLDQLIGEMTKFTHSLNSSDGTVGQLINNPELYQRMVIAARNLDAISRQLRPILDDARVFSDKIARHPELLGVKGAVKGSVGVK